MSTAFLEQRKTQLNMYLQSVLQPTILNNKDNLEMAKLVEQFLEPGRYEHTVKKSEFVFKYCVSSEAKTDQSVLNYILCQTSFTYQC